MYKYAKGINSIKELDNVNIYASDNSSVCMALSGALEARKKSHGLYIENGKVLVSNVFERIEVGDKIYKLYNLNTKSKTMNTQEYIESVDGKNLIWKYILDNDSLGRIARLNIIGNVVAFIPFGIFLPVLSHRRIKLIATTLYSFILSLAIELTQLITMVGSCDVDDLILNCLGGLTGYIIYAVWYKIIRRED